ncbi:MAG: FAD-dependent oxidoreductase [Solirubrobacterales bacterium]|nr:FAD-dependent oxidoreductase [Solirubrobacterales bacterium]
MTELDRPLRVAIIGSGPSGFYAAGHLLKQAGRPVEVDVYDRLPTPWGLVRGGVAPDHPKIKSVTRVYEKTALQPGFRFFGNIEVGRDVSQEDLAAWYDAVLYAVGTSGDKKSGIPGEDLPGSVSATEFVGWYNGHPDYRDLDFDLSGERAVVIGNGNVAVDVARMLTLTHDELAVTDVADHALEVLDASSITEIVVLGRRGPEQAAFTNPELLELGELLDADVVVDPADLDVPEELREDELEPTARRNVEILREYAQRAPSGKRKRVVLRFLSSPVEILGDGRVEAVKVVRNELVRDERGGLRAKATGETEVIEAGIVLRAIGYTGTPLPGVPFDAARGLIPHEDGRIVDDHGPVQGAYVAGWIKRGPSGVIGTNKKCAQETVDALLEDLEAGKLDLAAERPTAEEVVERLVERQPHLVDYEGWQSIDRHEKGLGEPQGRPRVKLTRVQELLDAAVAAAAARD